MKNRGSLSLLILLSSVFAHSQVPGVMPSIGLVAGVTARSAGIGGIRICRNEKLTAPTSVEVNRQSLLVGKYGDGTRVAIKLEQNELREIAAAVRNTARGRCIEVSIDPLADDTKTYASAELDDSPSIARALLELDADVAAILSGGIQPTGTNSPPFPTPDDEAERMLKGPGADPTYQHLATHMTRPPMSWHFTTLEIDPTRPKTTGVHAKVRPSLFALSPDGRRMQLPQEHERVALKPYDKVVTFMEQHLDQLAASVTSVDRGVRYGRAYTLLLACKQSPTCDSSLLEASAVPAKAQSSTSDFDIRDEAAQIRQERAALLRQLGLSARWHQFRLDSLNTKMQDAERLAMVVDEAATWYASLDGVQQLSAFGVPKPGPLFSSLQKIDLEQQPYAYWGYFARFVLGAWANADFERLFADLNRAWTSVPRAHAPRAQYEMLCALENLLPVIQSHVILERSESRTSPVVFDPFKLAPPRLERMEYLRYLSEHAPLERQQALLRKRQELESVALRLLEPTGHDGIRGSSKEALASLAEFEFYHLLRDHRRIPGTPLRTMGLLQSAIALALVQEGRSEALDWARMIDALSEYEAGLAVALGRQHYRVAIELRSWSAWVRQRASANNILGPQAQMVPLDALAAATMN